MKWLLFILFIICGGLNSAVFGQYQFPDDEIVYDDSQVSRVDIFIDSDSLAAILDEDNLESNYEYPADFVFTTTDTTYNIENVGFRLRGNTSRGAFKKSFKVSFNSFEDQQFFGLEKMNLNGEHNDPSIMRSKLCWDMCNWAGVPASRTSHVELYINTQYRGLYLNVEHIDEEFVEKRMADDSGNLYKCLWPADLHYKGEDPDLYAEFEPWGRQAYALKSNLQQYDYSDLAHFIDVLNNLSGEEFQCELEEIFDVDSYLKVIALDILMSNWDGPIVNKNNFYLYNNPCTNKFTYLPYDLDNTIGIDWLGIDWINSDIYNWSELSEEYRPIYEKLMAVPEYKNRFSFYMQTMLDDFFNNDFLDEYFDEKLIQLTPFRQNDSFANGDYGWDVADFEDSFEAEADAHVKYGLKNYVEIRHASAVSQLEVVDISPVVRNVEIDWSENLVQFDIQTFDNNSISEVIFHYQIEGNTWQSETLAVDSDGMSNFELTSNEVAVLTYYIEVTDDAGLSRDYPLCQDATIQLGFLETPDVVINEVMASNESAVTDEFSEFDDWIELYNNGDAAISLNDFYLSDNPDNHRKWQLPNTTLNPGQYIVIWADNDPEQGAFHTNFKLKKDGEFLGLFDSKSNHHAVIDSLSFPAQESDVSYARIPNGVGDFIFREQFTPFLNNETVVAVEDVEVAEMLVYPNPSRDFITIESQSGESFDLMLYDLNGKLVRGIKSADQLGVRDLSSGVYFLEIERGGVVVQRNKILVLPK